MVEIYLCGVSQFGEFDFLVAWRIVLVARTRVPIGR